LSALFAHKKQPKQVGKVTKIRTNFCFEVVRWYIIWKIFQ